MARIGPKTASWKTEDTRADVALFPGCIEWSEREAFLASELEAEARKFFCHCALSAPSGKMSDSLLADFCGWLLKKKDRCFPPLLYTYM
jgi:hypothetical protein